jgi:hypothetical protein
MEVRRSRLVVWCFAANGWALDRQFHLLVVVIVQPTAADTG